MSEITATAPYVGKKLKPKNFAVDDRALADYYSGLDISPPSCGLLPSFFASEPDGEYFGEIAFANKTGHLWMRQEWQPLRPIEQGPSYSVTGEITDIYEKRDRHVVCYQVELSDTAGACVLRSQHHQSFLADQTYSGEVQLRDPKKKPGVRKFDRPEGEPFGGLERTITATMCGEFFHGDANYHTDRAASRELGFDDVVVGGRMTMAYASHILEERFGEAWWHGGRLDLKFTNPVWAGDTVTARGVVTGTDDDTPERTTAFVWLEKPDETVVLVASATVAV